MRIAVDAMGGDHAPDAIVAGALLAARDFKGEILLVGRRAAVEPLLRAAGAGGGAPAAAVRVVDASEVIAMDEPGPQAVRRKKDSSLVIAAELVRAGEAQALVSAGHSGAVMTAALMKLGRLPGIDRPAIPAVLPALGPVGRVVLLDAGANVDCEPDNLRQFGTMGSIYAEAVLGIRQPRVGLLSNGEEECKGNALVRDAFPLLSAALLCFIGNVEGRELFQGKAEVVVCDGFVGNVVLKSSEGLVDMLWQRVKAELSAPLWVKLPGGIIKPRLERLRRQTDYASYGGMPLLGVNGVCIISHGRSNPLAIRNAIRAAEEAVCHDIVAKIAAHTEGQ